jgi:transcriptional regulator with XRE-family HTH domain
MTGPTQHDSGQRLADLVATVAANLSRVRTARGLSMGQLARAAGVSKATLSQLEAGTGNPSIETLLRLSVALGLPFAELITRPVAHVEVRRARDAVEIHSADSRFRGYLVHRSTAVPAAETYRFTLEAGAPYDAEPHPAGTRETVICLAGRLRVGPPAAAVDLDPGDSVTFSADLPHRYEALDGAAALVLILDYAAPVPPPRSPSELPERPPAS